MIIPLFGRWVFSRCADVCIPARFCTRDVTDTAFEYTSCASNADDPEVFVLVVGINHGNNTGLDLTDSDEPFFATVIQFVEEIENRPVR